MGDFFLATSLGIHLALGAAVALLAESRRAKLPFTMTTAVVLLWPLALLEACVAAVRERRRRR